MKNTLLFGFIALVAIGIASCSNDKTYNDMAQLPESVQNVINDNFTSPVTIAEVESGTIGVDEYEVYLADGTKVSFAGEVWDEVKVPAGQSVPVAFIVEPIQTYVAENYPGQAIVKIERDRTGYDVKLANGVDIEFDNNGLFVKID